MNPDENQESEDQRRKRLRESILTEKVSAKNMYCCNVTPGSQWILRLGADKLWMEAHNAGAMTLPVMLKKCYARAGTKSVLLYQSGSPLGRGVIELLMNQRMMNYMKASQLLWLGLVRAGDNLSGVHFKNLTQHDIAHAESELIRYSIAQKTRNAKYMAWARSFLESMKTDESNEKKTEFSVHKTMLVLKNALVDYMKPQWQSMFKRGRYGPELHGSFVEDVGISVRYGRGKWKKLLDLDRKRGARLGVKRTRKSCRAPFYADSMKKLVTRIAGETIVGNNDEYWKTKPGIAPLEASTWREAVNCKMLWQRNAERKWVKSLFVINEANYVRGSVMNIAKHCWRCNRLMDPRGWKWVARLAKVGWHPIRSFTGYVSLMHDDMIVQVKVCFALPYCSTCVIENQENDFYCGLDLTNQRQRVYLRKAIELLMNRSSLVLMSDMCILGEGLHSVKLLDLDY
jgi:hypothetical protein